MVDNVVLPFSGRESVARRMVFQIAADSVTLVNGEWEEEIGVVGKLTEENELRFLTKHIRLAELLVVQ